MKETWHRAVRNGVSMGVAWFTGGVVTAGFTFLSGGVPTPWGVALGWATGTWAGYNVDKLFISWG